MSDKKSLTPHSAALGVSAVILYLTIFHRIIMSLFGSVAALVIGELVILAVPIVLSLLKKANIKAVFRLRLPTPSEIIACGGLYFGTQLITLAYSTAGMLFGDFYSRNAAIASSVKSMGLPIAIIVTALLPAICEELFCRGFLLSACRAEQNQYAAIAVSALVFGAIHFDIYTFFPAALMGVAFGIITVKTRSVFLAIAFHLHNNCKAVIQAFASEKASILTELEDSALIRSSIILLLIGVIAVFLCLILLKRLNKRRAEKAEPAEVQPPES